MNEFKGTQGKWKYSVKYRGSTKKSLIQVEIPNNLTLTVGEIGLDDCTVACCCNIEQHRNALLISKAPEMLKMLKRVYNEQPHQHLYSEVLKLIKEATEF